MNEYNRHIPIKGQISKDEEVFRTASINLSILLMNKMIEDESLSARNRLTLSAIKGVILHMATELGVPVKENYKEINATVDAELDRLGIPKV